MQIISRLFGGFLLDSLCFNSYKKLKMYGVDWISKVLIFASFFAVVATLHELKDSEFSSESTIFTNQWAVHVTGGDRVADDIAKRHGFINLGKVFKSIMILGSGQLSASTLIR